MEEFELEPVSNIDLVEISSVEQECIDDLEEARTTYKKLIKEGLNNVKLANDIITDTAHPRSIEVFANLINTISTINGKLVELQTTKRELTKKEQKQEQLPGSVTNNLFVGSPKDLLEMISAAKN